MATEVVPATVMATGLGGSGTDNILEIFDYSGGFTRKKEFTPVLHGVTFSVRRSVITAVVGETGSGKSITALSVLGLLPANFRRTSGQLLFDGVNLFDDEPAAYQALRGRRISLVFQDARASLNPVFTVGRQLTDVCRVHQKVDRKTAAVLAVEMLERVRIPEPARRMRQYPHEFSGGMAQRAMLAMALISKPELLLLDEPTTGLDVTIQADIMALIVDLVTTSGMSACLITHDLGVVAETCQDIVVMRDGRVRETGSCQQIFTNPKDQYTQELMAASRLVESL